MVWKIYLEKYGFPALWEYGGWRLRSVFLHSGYLKAFYRPPPKQSGAKRKARIHRLVAEAFIPNPEGKPQVNHKDLNKLNNHVDNLEWVTVSENAIHYYANRRVARKTVHDDVATIPLHL